MRKTVTIALSLPAEIVDRLRTESKKLGLSVSGYAKIVLAAGIDAPLPQLLREGVREDGPAL